MQDRYAYQIMPPSAGEPGRSTPPSSSRMLASYLSDIELLLEEQRWEQALREAFDLPQIATALSDPRMQVSVDGLDEILLTEGGDAQLDYIAPAAKADYETMDALCAIVAPSCASS